VDEGLIDVPTALERLAAYDLGAIARLRVEENGRAEPLGAGVPAGGGMVSGRMALTIDIAQRYHADQDPVVLVRDAAATEDIAGLAVCRGLVTATGARTSHAAVVARQLGVSCVVACRGLGLDLERRRARFGPVALDEGEVVSLDGATGTLYRGEPDVVVERPDELVSRVQEWREAQTEEPAGTGPAGR
jgi:pyruvate,orthophosphate dikinase